MIHKICGSKEEIIRAIDNTKSELEKLMNTAENDRERDAIRNALDHMNR